MTGLFIALDEYIVPPEVLAVEFAERLLAIEEPAREEYDYYPSKANHTEHPDGRVRI